jgi:hypothetical protein
MYNLDISAESLISINAAAKKIPGRPHIGTVWRWILTGLNGTKLESAKVGGRRYTSEEAIQRFIAATTAAADGEQPLIRSPLQRRRAIEQADRDLSQDGI